MVGAEALAPLVERVSPSARRSALLGNLDLFAGRLVSAEQRLNEAWQAEDRSPPSLAGALCEQVIVCLMQGRGDEAVLWGRRAVEVSAGDLPAHNRARGQLSLALVWTYRVREALALLEHLPGPGGKLAADDLDPLIFRGTARLCAGYPELAFPDLSHAAARLRGGSSARYAPTCLTYLACAEYLLGAWDDALAHAELSVALVRNAGYAMWSPLAHQDATLVPIGRGDFGLAARHIEAANAAAACWEGRGLARLLPRRPLPWPGGPRVTPSTRWPRCARSGRASGSGSPACSTGVLWRSRPSSRWASSTLLLNVSANSSSSKATTPLRLPVSIPPASGRCSRWRVETALRRPGPSPPPGSTRAALGFRSSWRGSKWTRRGSFARAGSESERSRACARPPPASLPWGRVPTRSFATRSSPVAKPSRRPTKRVVSSGSAPLSSL